jgi:hypothetical protein
MKSRKDWISICQAASVEEDTEKLLALVSELTKVLDESLAHPSRGRLLYESDGV